MYYQPLNHPPLVNVYQLSNNNYRIHIQRLAYRLHYSTLVKKQIS